MSVRVITKQRGIARKTTLTGCSVELGPLVKLTVYTHSCRGDGHRHRHTQTTQAGGGVGGGGGAKTEPFQAWCGETITESREKSQRGSRSLFLIRRETGDIAHCKAVGETKSQDGIRSPTIGPFPFDPSWTGTSPDLDQ